MLFAEEMIERALCPRSVALVGASGRSPFSVRLYENLIRNGFTGPIALINPRRAEVFGKACHHSLLDFGPVDVAIITVPREAVEAAVDDALAVGCAGIIILAVGLRDSGESAWIDAEERIAEKIRSAGRIMIGPNGLGAVFAPAACAAIGAPVWWDLGEGGIALAMQSGALLHSAMICLNDMGVKVAHAISTGNGSGTSLGEWASIFADRQEVRTIGLLIEELGSDWAGFAQAAAKARASGKRIVVLKMGRTALGQAVAQSHTGALAGEYAVFSDALRQIGVLEADSFGTFVGALALSEHHGEPVAPGIAILSPTGGTNGLMADLCAAVAVSVAVPSAQTEAALRALPNFSGLTNPLDLNARWSFDLDAIETGVTLLLKDESVGAAVFGVPLLPDEHFEPLIAQLERLAMVADAVGKPLILTEVGYGKVDHVLSNFLQAHPRVLRIPNAVEALGVIRLWTANLPRPAQSPAPTQDLGPVRQLGNEHILKQQIGEAVRMARLDVAIPDGRFFAFPWKASDVAAIGKAGERYFLKVMGPAILHKSRMGMMQGPLGSDELAASAETLAAAAVSFGHEAEGLLIEPMAPAGFDLIVGISRQPSGFAVMIGAGGVDVEERRLVRFAMLPAEPDYIVQLVLDVCDQAGCDDAMLGGIPALAPLVELLGELAKSSGMRSLECNPVRLTADGKLWLLDALALG